MRGYAADPELWLEDYAEAFQVGVHLLYLLCHAYVIAGCVMCLSICGFPLALPGAGYREA